MSKTKIHIGTSGWNYKHWKGNFYPEELPQKKWLEFYNNKLSTVEINNSFYKLPSKETFKKWAEGVPNDFIFSVKASRYITHMKKLKDPEESNKKLFDNMKGLGKKLGPILFQLPPHWGFNKERFEEFLKSLSKKYKYTFEFREQSWWNNETLDLLKKYNAAFCIFELGDLISPKEVTADFIYIRLHGPGNKYRGSYNENTLSYWKGRFTGWSENVKEIYCYFDNDDSGFAVQNAITLNEKIN